VVFTELPGGVTEWLQGFGYRNILGLQAESGGRQPYLGETGAQRRLPRDK